MSCSRQFVQYRTIALTTDVLSGSADLTKLAHLFSDGVEAFTGRDTGRILLTAEVWDTAPERDQTMEESVELDLGIVKKPLRNWIWGDYREPAFQVHLQPDIEYMVRWSARGRRESLGSMTLVNDPFEHQLAQIWPRPSQTS